MQTPEYFHCLDDKEFREHVYEPEADSFLLLDALDLEADKLRSLQSRRCVEIGCGSGIAITHLCTLLHKSWCEQSVTEKHIAENQHNYLADNETKLYRDEQTINATSREVNVTELEEDHCYEKVNNDKPGTNLEYNTEFYAVDINPKALEATSLTWERTLRKYMSVKLEEAVKGANVENYSFTNINDVRHQSKVATLTTKEIRNVHYGTTCTLESLQLHLVLGDLLTPFSKVNQIQEQNNHKIAYKIDNKATDMSLSYVNENFLNRSGNTVSTACENDKSKCNVEFDVILFNPPYVPTSMEELELAISATSVSYKEITNTQEYENINSKTTTINDIDHVKQSGNAIAAAWCGGPRGRVVIDRFIAMLPEYMSRRGVCYLVLIKENDLDDVITLIHRTFALHNSYHVHESEENQQQRCEKSISAQGDNVERNSNSTNSLVHVELINSRYTGEHLSVYRIAYADNSVFTSK